THAYALASHLVYGFVTETIRTALRLVLQRVLDAAGRRPQGLGKHDGDQYHRSARDLRGLEPLAESEPRGHGTDHRLGCRDEAHACRGYEAHRGQLQRERN